jgi:hypothetical protein
MEGLWFLVSGYKVFTGWAWRPIKWLITEPFAKLISVAVTDIIGRVAPAD